MTDYVRCVVATCGWHNGGTANGAGETACNTDAGGGPAPCLFNLTAHADPDDDHDLSTYPSITQPEGEPMTDRPTPPGPPGPPRHTHTDGTECQFDVMTGRNYWIDKSTATAQLQPCPGWPEDPPPAPDETPDPDMSSMPAGPVPDLPLTRRQPCRLARVGPPPGQEEHVAPAEMIHGRTSMGDIWCAYVKPTPEQLAVLNAGGYIEMVQWTPQVVPFGLAVWRGDPG